MVVSPDVGGVARARAFAKKLNDAPLAIVDKRRSAHNVSEVMNLIGDVKDKVAVLVDDMIDTAGERPLPARWLLQAQDVIGMSCWSDGSAPPSHGPACAATTAQLGHQKKISCTFVCISVSGKDASAEESRSTEMPMWEDMNLPGV